MRLLLLLSLLLLAACAAGGEPARSFDAGGVTRVVLRAAEAERAEVERSPPGRITVSGRATGGAEGYHPADPKWRETPAAEWGLDFVARRFGSVLVISTRNEIGYIHHHYAITGIALRVPPGVAVERQARRLSGSGEADLSPP